MRTTKLRDLAGLVGTDASVNINANPCTDRQVWANFREAKRILGMICQAKIPMRTAGAAPAIADQVQKATCNATWAAATAEYWTVSTGAGTVRLRKPTNTTSFGEPVLRNNDTVLYMLDSAGVKWAVSDYLGPPLGTLDFWALDKAVIPSGWGLADGAGNLTGTGRVLTGYMFEASIGYGLDELGQYTTWDPVNLVWIFSGTIATDTANITVGDPVAPFIEPINIGNYFFIEDHVDTTYSSQTSSQTLGPRTVVLDPSTSTIVVEDDQGGSGVPRVTSHEDTNIGQWDGMEVGGQHAHVVNVAPKSMKQVSGKHPRTSVTWMEDEWEAHVHRLTDPKHHHDVEPHVHGLPNEPHTHPTDPHDHVWSETPAHLHGVELEHFVYGLHNHAQIPHTHTVIDAGHEHEGIEVDNDTIPPHAHLSKKPERKTIIPIERLA